MTDHDFERMRARVHGGVNNRIMEFMNSVSPRPPPPPEVVEPAPPPSTADERTSSLLRDAYEKQAKRNKKEHDKRMESRIRERPPETPPESSAPQPPRKRRSTVAFDSPS